MEQGITNAKCTIQPTCKHYRALISWLHLKGRVGPGVSPRGVTEPYVRAAELREEWTGRISQKDLLALETARAGYAGGDAEITSEQAAQYAPEHSFQNASTISKKFGNQIREWLTGNARLSEHSTCFANM